MNLLEKAKELEKLNDEIYQYTYQNSMSNVFWNCNYIGEHIRDLKESIIDYNKNKGSG